MDFTTLLHKAQKNEKSNKNEGVRYYSTKFEPPKKEQRSKQLSENIKKFLARKEEEERQKKLEAARKKDELLALRSMDKKAQRRVSVMLKRTKSASQACMQDAIDSNNTSITMNEPQPDEDDYGYVSQEASAFYNKMMEKYSKMPDEPKFNLLNNKKKPSSSTTTTKTTVATTTINDESDPPHKRRKKDDYHDYNNDNYRDNDVSKPKQKQPPPPPLNFNELLKIAEKKQYEPIVLPPKPKDDERLFTKKQKKEVDREREWRERKEKELQNKNHNNISNNIPSNNNNNNNNQQKLKNNTEILKNSNREIPKKSTIDNIKKIQDVKRIENRKILDTNNNHNNSNNKLDKNKIAIKSNNAIPKPSINTKQQIKQNPINNNNKQSNQDMRIRDVKKDTPTKAPITINNNNNNKEVKPKLPPPSMPPKRDNLNNKSMKKKPMNKRRILDDDEEYDSEMDDFIDDGPEDAEDYSKYISEIFGYDKSKYRHVDDDVDNMESSFAQQMREEVISTKIGIMEDLEDMKKEEEEKRRKALMKKKMKS